jgi:ATP-binding protein involved in chromosome partitioning
MECENLADLSQTAIDHARHPRNLGPLDHFNGRARITGPCGDTMEFWLMVRDRKVEGISYTTDGCGSSHACGSMATCIVKDRAFGVAYRLSQHDIVEALGGLPSAIEHCALLAANTVHAACEDYLRSVKSAPSPKTENSGERDELTCSPTSKTAGQPAEKAAQEERLRQRLTRIRHKIVVLSGKGGVGKSTVAVNLAVAIQRSGKRVGLLDVDIHGPSVPTMLGLETETIAAADGEMIPVDLGGLKVISIGFMLKDRDAAVIWRGPMKMGVIRQFLQDVAWGDLDFLIIDSPPGTGDEPLSVCQLVGNLDGAVIVTTPQKVAAVDVRKSITFCRRLGVPVLGVIENMSGFVCPHCGVVTQILRVGAGQRMATDLAVPFLGSIPIDPAIADSCDDGQPFLKRDQGSPAANLMQEILTRVEEEVEGSGIMPYAVHNEERVTKT